MGEKTQVNFTEEAWEDDYWCVISLELSTLNTILINNTSLQLEKICQETGYKPFLDMLEKVDDELHGPSCRGQVDRILEEWRAGGDCFYGHAQNFQCGAESEEMAREFDQRVCAAIDEFWEGLSMAPAGDISTLTKKCTAEEMENYIKVYADGLQELDEHIQKEENIYTHQGALNDSGHNNAAIAALQVPLMGVEKAVRNVLQNAVNEMRSDDTGRYQTIESKTIVNEQISAEQVVEASSADIDIAMLQDP